MNTLHPYVPLVVAGLILIGASSLGPNSMTTSPIAESISPTMAPSDNVLAGAVEIDPAPMTLGLEWSTVLRPQENPGPRKLNDPIVTAADPRYPVEPFGDQRQQPEPPEQAAMLSPMFRLENAGRRGVRFQDDTRLPSKMQRMMHSFASAVA